MKKYYTTFVFVAQTGVSNPQIMGVYTIPECRYFSVLTEIVFKTYVL